MKRKVILTGLTLIICFVILFISSSFKATFLSEPTYCSGSACEPGWNPNTQDSIYYWTGLVRSEWVCCYDECTPTFQGCKKINPE